MDDRHLPVLVAETLAALDKLVPELRKRGFRLVSLSSLAGVPRSAFELPATSWQRVRGRALIAALAVARTLTGVFGALPWRYASTSGGVIASCPGQNGQCSRPRTVADSK